MNEAEARKRKAATMHIVTAYEKLHESDKRPELDKAREFIFGAIMTACSANYRDVVKAQDGDVGAGELQGDLAIDATMQALWSIMTTGGIDCDHADDILCEAVDNTHEWHHRRLRESAERRKAKRNEPSEN